MAVAVANQTLHERRKENKRRYEAGEISQEEFKRLRKRDRAKARRKTARAQKLVFEAYKPVEEWDEEEWARGRPRSEDGHFRGAKPDWVPTVVVEQAISMFREVQEGKLRATVPAAITALDFVLNNDDVDGKGRRIVPIPTKLAAAQFAIEHLVGKPKQRVEADISVKLQGILAEVMVMPDGSPAIDRTTPLDVESEEVDLD